MTPPPTARGGVATGGTLYPSHPPQPPTLSPSPTTKELYRIARAYLTLDGKLEEGVWPRFPKEFTRGSEKLVLFMKMIVTSNAKTEDNETRVGYHPTPTQHPSPLSPPRPVQPPPHTPSHPRALHRDKPRPRPTKGHSPGAKTPSATGRRGRLSVIRPTRATR